VSQSPSELSAQYQLVASCRTGETLFFALNDGLGYAKEPLLEEAKHFTMPLTLICAGPHVHRRPCARSHWRRARVPARTDGQFDIMPSDTGFLIRDQVPHGNVQINVIPGSGHHPYASHAGVFNGIMLKRLSPWALSASSHQPRGSVQ
jgi:hypothetical protein